MYVQRVLHSDRDSRTDTSTRKLTAVGCYIASTSTVYVNLLYSMSELYKSKLLFVIFEEHH